MTPLTISWCAWCDIEISNGDFLNLIVSMNRKPINTPGMYIAFGSGAAMISLILNVPAPKATSVAV